MMDSFFNTKPNNNNYPIPSPSLHPLHPPHSAHPAHNTLPHTQNPHYPTQQSHLRPTAEHTWHNDEHHSQATFVPRPVEPVTSRDPSFSNGFKSNWPTPLITNPSKNEAKFPHQRNASQCVAQPIKSSYEEFRQMHSQYPSISTQDRTPKNNEESTFLLTLGQNKKEEPWRSVETREETKDKKEIKGIRGTEGSCKIRQIKEELLNQGRREKEEAGKREMPTSTGTIETTATITQQMTGSGTYEPVGRPVEAYSITKETRETRQTSGISITTLKAGITGITKTPASTGTATSTTTAASGYWIDEKIKLTRLLEEKNSKIAELEKKTLQIEQEHRSKVAILEHEKRKAEGTKNRVEIEADNTRKLLQIERGKTDEALEQMNKLIFFEDDLIHARDYNRLKQEMEEVLRENAAMFQDHQRYIIEVAQNRRQMTNRLEELEAELASLKLEAVQWAQKVEGFNTMSEDKLRLVKCQNEVVFLMRKAEESREVSQKQEQNLERAHMQMKEAAEEETRRRDGSEKNILDGLNMEQLISSIARYESRLQDMGELLRLKSLELEKARKVADYYSSELSKSKEDRKITSLKERSQENSLKNDLTALQHSLQSDIDLQAKKILSLQEKVKRKMREVVDKDSFIKDFLLTRVKDIGSLSFDQLITTIHRHFTPEQQEQGVQTEQEVFDREMQTEWKEVEDVESEDSLEAVQSIVIMEPADEGIVIMEKMEDQPTMEEVEEPLKEENIKQTATGEANLESEQKEQLEELHITLPYQDIVRQIVEELIDSVVSGQLAEVSLGEEEEEEKECMMVLESTLRDEDQEEEESQGKQAKLLPAQKQSEEEEEEEEEQSEEDEELGQVSEDQEDGYEIFQDAMEDPDLVDSKGGSEGQPLDM